MLPDDTYHATPQRYAMKFRRPGQQAVWTFYSRSDLAAWVYAGTHLAQEYPDAILLDVYRCPEAGPEAAHEYRQARLLVPALCRPAAGTRVPGRMRSVSHER